VRTAVGTVRVLEGFAITLRDQTGARGHGEVVPRPWSGTEDLAASGCGISEFAPACACDYGLSGFLDLLAEALPDKPALRCAFDTAAHEIEARLRDTTVADVFGGQPSGIVAVSALLGVADLERTVCDALRLVERGYRTLELKVGADAPADDAARVIAVRDAVGPDVHLRIDADGGCTESRAFELLERLAHVDLELFEQPVPADDFDALRRLSEKSGVAIAADGALATPAGRRIFLEGGLAGAAAIQPLRLGGLRPALRFARRAAAQGLACYVSGGLEGPVGTAAGLQLAAALPPSGLAHALAASELVDAGFAPGLQPVAGALAPEPPSPLLLH
jgi:L-alanine-DL-glutamate epimerase-like enolase superfamily enzyme